MRSRITRSIAGVELWRWLAALLAVALLVVAFVAGGSSTAAVAKVDGKPITLDTYRHWLVASAVSAHASNASLPAFVPDAPSYTRCIAFERQAATKGGKKAPSDATLLNACKTLRVDLAESVIGLLVGGQWVLDQAAREHVTVSAAQVQSSLHRSFSNTSGLTQYLQTSKLSRSELEYQVRIGLTLQQLDRLHSGPTPNITAAQISSYYNANRSQIKETLAQATPAIRSLLISQAQAPRLNPYLANMQTYWLKRTTCAEGYRLASYCRRS